MLTLPKPRPSPFFAPEKPRARQRQSRRTEAIRCGIFWFAHSRINERSALMMANDLRVFDGLWNEAPAGSVLAITARYDEFILAMRIRAEAAGFAYLDLDHAAGLSSGVTSRIFGPSQSLGLGPRSLDRLLKALKLKIAIVAEEQPIPPRPKDCRQDRHPLVSPHLPPRDEGSRPNIPA